MLWSSSGRRYIWASACRLYKVLKSAPLLSQYSDIQTRTDTTPHQSWHTVNVSRIDLLQDVEVLRPMVPVHKDKVLLFLDDTGKQFKQSTYIQSLSYDCLSVLFVWTDRGNCVFYDREDMHLFSTGTELLLQYDACKIQLQLVSN